MIEDLLGIERRLLVDRLEDQALVFADVGKALHQPIRFEELADLEADLLVFVRIEGGDARLGRAEAVFAEPLLFEHVEADMVGHHELCAVGHNDLRMDAAPQQLVVFGKKAVEVERNAMPDHIGHMVVADAGGQQMQRKFALVIDDGVAGVRAALKTDDNIRIRRKHVGHLALALVTPVAAYNRLYHRNSSTSIGLALRGSLFVLPFSCRIFILPLSLFVRTFRLKMQKFHSTVMMP